MLTVDTAVEGWIRHFYSADRVLTFRAAEQELAVALADDVLLVGITDAIGDDFFGEWKFLSKWNKGAWREKWRFHPQSLTYGLLLRETHPEISRFTIRVCIKGDVPEYDHEWFTYSQGELDTWRDEVLHIAARIRGYDVSRHWPLNPLSCYKWGPKYPCQFVHACTHQEWDVPIAGLVPRTLSPFEQKVNESPDPHKPLILSATRIEKYLECPEAFRRIYTGAGEVEAEGEALTFGKQSHRLLGEYYRQLAGGLKCPSKVIH